MEHKGRVSHDEAMAYEAARAILTQLHAHAAATADHDPGPESIQQRDELAARLRTLSPTDTAAVLTVLEHDGPRLRAIRDHR